MVYLYHDYIDTLSKRFLANLSTIETEHNFEYGVEFEIVLCETLRSALPDKVGIARGYVVDADGQRAGDDIVLFERHRFPSLALRDRDNYSRKEFIPAEATYCYIEAKHTLNLTGDDAQSLSVACEQVKKVKALCSKRERVPLNQILPHVSLRQGMKVTTPENFPSYLNPSFAAIIARQVRRKKGEQVIANPNEINSILTSLSLTGPELPDIMVLGESNVVFPVVPSGQSNSARVSSPFFIPNLSTYRTRIANGLAFGIGLVSIMWAVEWIQLGTMPWSRIIADALGLPLTNFDQS